MTKKILSLLLLFIAINGCTKDQDDNLPKEPVPINLTGTQVEMINSGNDFAFDIFRKIAGSEGESGNLIISPLSISYALSMTVNGANGATRDSMIKTLRMQGITIPDLNTSYKDLTESLLTVDKRITMTVANSVWTENDFNVKPSFTGVLTQYYNAESKSFDITDATTPVKINAWIEQKTNGLIKNMIDKLNDNAVMLLINAIYFKGKWQLQFDKSETVKEDFSLSNGNKVSVPMMKINDEFVYYAGNGFKIAEFPYGQGNFVMDVILPDPQKNVNSLLTEITGSSFTSWTNNTNRRKLEVSFPRFKYGYKKKLKDVLSGMGMKIAFTGSASDFTNIADQPPLVINEVTHQAFIETNEEGSEAAAATVVEIGFTSIGPNNTEFRMDRPFIYLIRETTTNTVLFMGRVENPLQE